MRNCFGAFVFRVHPRVQDDFSGLGFEQIRIGADTGVATETFKDHDEQNRRKARGPWVRSGTLSTHPPHREPSPNPPALKLGWVFRLQHLRFANRMNFSLDPYNLLAGFIFGTIGWGAWRYGGRLELWQPRLIGMVLMVYPYLFTNMWLLWGIGVGLLVTLWFYHDE